MNPLLDHILLINTLAMAIMEMSRTLSHRVDSKSPQEWPLCFLCYPYFPQCTHLTPVSLMFPTFDPESLSKNLIHFTFYTHDIRASVTNSCPPTSVLPQREFMELGRDRDAYHLHQLGCQRAQRHKRTLRVALDIEHGVERFGLS